MLNYSANCELFNTIETGNRQVQEQFPTSLVELCHVDILPDVIGERSTNQCVNQSVSKREACLSSDKGRRWS